MSKPSQNTLKKGSQNLPKSLQYHPGASLGSDSRKIAPKVMKLVSSWDPFGCPLGCHWPQFSIKKRLKKRSYFRMLFLSLFCSFRPLFWEPFGTYFCTMLDSSEYVKKVLGLEREPFPESFRRSKTQAFSVCSPKALKRHLLTPIWVHFHLQNGSKCGPQ